MGLSNLNSRETALVAVLSAMLGTIGEIIFSFVYPALPPIVVFPFVVCFFFGVTLSLTGRQLVIGLIGFLLMSVLRGAFLPGQLMVPIYALLFQVCEGKWYRSAAIVGFCGSVLHAVYGVLLAPLIFSVAPAKVVISWLIPYMGQFAFAIAAMMIIFGVVGMLAAEAGRQMGLRVFKKLNSGLVRIDVGRVGGSDVDSQRFTDRRRVLTVRVDTAFHSVAFSLVLSSSCFSQHAHFLKGLLHPHSLSIIQRGQVL